MPVNVDAIANVKNCNCTRLSGFLYKTVSRDMVSN